MSQMPDKIWLHKDTKYNTGDIVCGYQYEFAQGIEDEGGIENFVEYVPADAFIDKATEWLCYNYDKYIRIIGSSVYPAYAELCKDFQKAMKGE